MQHETGSLAGRGKLTLFTQRWLPDGSPRAIVLLAHGIAEHSGRYAHVARALTERDYAVYALDHRGHGRSEGARVTVDQFSDYVADLRAYFEQIRAEWPALPIVLYGHSMGSLIALLFAAQYQDDLAGLITTGTALILPGSNAFTRGLLRLVDRVMPNTRLIPFDARSVSRDPAVVAAYVGDPLVDTRRVQSHMATELSSAAIRAKGALGVLRLPYLALHGSHDTACHPRGAQIIRETCTSPDLTVTVYDGLYHEIHNEPEQAQVLQDIADWLDAHIPA